MQLGFMKDSGGADKMVRSAFARHMYPSQVVPFGETVIFRDTGPTKCKLRSNWNFGVWLGRDSQDDMHILGTRQGW